VTTSDAEIIEGELVPDVISAAPAPITLFGTSDPRLALARMAEIATALVDVIDARRLYVTIGGRKHITVEGWTTLGGMTGVVPIVTDTRANESGDGIVAHVEVRRVADGMVVGAAEGECSRAESKWKSRDPYALRSMAQTRAISRALRAPLGQIVVLAGYDPAGAEEMPAEPDDKPDRGKMAGYNPTGAEEVPLEPSEDGMTTAGTPSPATLLQRQQMRSLFERLRDAAPHVDWTSQCSALAGKQGDELTEPEAERVIEQMRAWIAEMGGSDIDAE
jgi:hypothetical protein